MTPPLDVIRAAEKLIVWAIEAVIAVVVFLLALVLATVI